MKDPEKLIVTALTIAAGVVTWRGLREGTLTPLSYVSFVIVAIILLTLGQFVPDLAAAFAILILVALFLGVRPPTFAGAGTAPGKGGQQ